MKNEVLPEFQDYLRSKSLVQKKYIPFHAHWASKFLIFLDKNEPVHQDLFVENYLNYLRAQ